MLDQIMCALLVVIALINWSAINYNNNNWVPNRIRPDSME